MTGARVAAAILRKDLLLDLRLGDRLGQMWVFAALVIVLMSITLPAVNDETRAWVPALLWTIALLASLLGLARSLQTERDDGAIQQLVQVPCDRGWVFLGKVAANWLALFALLLWIALLSALFLDVAWTRAGFEMIGLALLGSLGLAALGTLLATLASSSRFAQFLLPVLLFPLMLPILVWASLLTRDLLGGQISAAPLWGVLALYDWIFLLIGYFTFNAILED